MQTQHDKKRISDILYRCTISHAIWTNYKLLAGTLVSQSQPFSDGKSGTWHRWTVSKTAYLSGRPYATVLYTTDSTEPLYNKHDLKYDSQKWPIGLQADIEAKVSESAWIPCVTPEVHWPISVSDNTDSQWELCCRSLEMLPSLTCCMYDVQDDSHHGDALQMNARGWDYTGTCTHMYDMLCEPWTWIDVQQSDW